MPVKGKLLVLYIFNSILRLSHFPSNWKTARVITLLKPGKITSDLSSWRPISILSVFSKLIERLILTRMCEYMNDELPNHQFGFRTGHGTPEQCHRIVDFIKHTFENEEYCSGVFLDISKAFDKVWHSGLLYKIKYIFPAYLFVLLKSNLEDRKFFVQIGVENSQMGMFESGVPQGSVLGPHLYVLYTRDMPNLMGGLTATFADDTAFLYTDTDASSASEKIQDHLNILAIWMKRWNIRVNADKCEHITFTLNDGRCPTVKFNGQDIPQKDSVRYLGLHLDEKLTFKTHYKEKKAA